METQITRLSATEIGSRIASRSVSAREVVEAHLERIEEINPRLNAVVQISDRCDCDDAKKIVAQDIGYLAGEDPVAIDTASIELINKQEGKNVFLEENKKDPLTHVKDAEKLGMGSAEYEVEM